MRNRGVEVCEINVIVKKYTTVAIVAEIAVSVGIVGLVMLVKSVRKKEKMVFNYCTFRRIFTLNSS